jgi:hypothetical protein
MAARGIDATLVRRALEHPTEVRDVGQGRTVVHFLTPSADRPYLLRIFLDTDRNPPEVVTVYRTSKVSKYLDRL